MPPLLRLKRLFPLDEAGGVGVAQIIQAGPYPVGRRGPNEQ